MKGLFAKYGLLRKVSATNANTAVAGALVGTPVVPALAADSLIFSNKTASGDILIAGNRGGNSEAFLFADVSASTVDLLIRGVSQIQLTTSGITFTGTALTYNDDVLLGIGTGNTARFSWDTTDANANELLLQMPAGGAVDVPVLAIGQSIESVDLGLFNGVVDPTIAVFGVGAVTTGPRVRVYKARGTIAAPTVVTTGDDLFSIDAYGAVAAGEYVQAARILFEMTGTIATTRGPGVITFQTATDAAPSVLTTALTISAAQLVTVASGLVVASGGLRMTQNNSVAMGQSVISPAISGHGISNNAVAIGLSHWSDDTSIPRFIFGKSRGGSVGTAGIVQNGDEIGRVLWTADDGTDMQSDAAAIWATASGTMAANQIGGALLFGTAADGTQSITTRLTISNAGLATFTGSIQGNTRIDVGVSGTTTGIIGIDGTTSGTVNLTVAAAAGAWTMTLPTGVAGTGGFQLTDAAGDGVTSWAAASLGEWKNDLGILDPHEALRAVVESPTHIFTYKPEVMPPGIWAPPDRMTGVFAEEAPWAMHGKREGRRSGIAFSNINALGYARAAIQALYEDLEAQAVEIAGLKSELARSK